MMLQTDKSIALEDLNVSGMLKNRKLSRAISQAGWREFRTMCEAKSNKFGREFVVTADGNQLVKFVQIVATTGAS